MKYCTKCHTITSNFGRNKSKFDGLQSYCKECNKEYVIENSRKEYGVIRTIYASQRDSSRKRGHKMPNYSKKELVDWLYRYTSFTGIYKRWVESGYICSLKPSVDRINDFLPYTLSNIQLGTWLENLCKPRLTNPQCKKVLYGGVVYDSISQCTKETGLSYYMIALSNKSSVVVLDK